MNIIHTLAMVSAMFILMTGCGAAQSLSIDQGGVNPSSVTDKAKGIEISVEVTYEIEGVSGDCFLRVDENSLPEGWSVEENPKLISCSSGTSSTPVIAANTKYSGNINVYVESNNPSMSDQGSFYVDVGEGAILDPKLVSPSSMEVQRGRSYEIEMNVKNMGDMDSKNAVASLSCPSGYSGDCGKSISISEAGESEGVIKVGRNIYTSFDINANNPTNGEVSITFEALNSPQGSSVNVSTLLDEEGGRDDPSGSGSPGSPTSQPKEAKTWESLRKGKYNLMKVESPGKYGISALNFSTTRSVSNAQLSVFKQENAPQEPGKIQRGYKYRYVEIESKNLADEDLEEVNIGFHVNKSWLSNKDLDSDQIKMARYHNGEWNTLDTFEVSQDSDKVYYRAESPGFSYFAIFGVQEQGKQECPYQCCQGMDQYKNKSCSDGQKCEENVCVEIQECPECPGPSDWTECVNGVRNRTNYRCSSETDYKCEEYTESEDCSPQSILPLPLLAGVVALIILALVVFYLFNKSGQVKETPKSGIERELENVVEEVKGKMERMDEIPKEDIIDRKIVEAENLVGRGNYKEALELYREVNEEL